MCLSSPPSLSQIRVSQLQVDGGWQRRLPRASKSLYTPRFSSFWRHLDETGGQFRQTQADQQWTGWSRTCESKNPNSLSLPLPLFALELPSPRLWWTDKIKAFIESPLKKEASAFLCFLWNFIHHTSNLWLTSASHQMVFVRQKPRAPCTDSLVRGAFRDRKMGRIRKWWEKAQHAVEQFAGKQLTWQFWLTVKRIYKFWMHL